MDLITQGLIGASMALSISARTHRRVAAASGFLSGMLADADALIRSSNDSLLYLEYHRHFSHALVFIPFGAAIAMLLLWPVLRRLWPDAGVTPTRFYLYCLAGYSLSGFIDACTSYGTHLFWPFSDERIAWNIVAIVDPVVSLLLIAGIAFALLRHRAWPARLGLLCVALYLFTGLMQHQRATAVALDLAQSRGHQVDRMAVKPTLGNLLLWRAVYIHGNRISIDAIRVATDSRVYQGTEIERMLADVPGDDIPQNSVLHDDIRRFSLFSEGYIARDPVRPDIIIDARYSMLPDSGRPLWGIRIDTARPQQHVSFEFFRENSREQRRRFFDMLLGN